MNFTLPTGSYLNDHFFQWGSSFLHKIICLSEQALMSFLMIGMSSPDLMKPIADHYLVAALHGRLPLYKDWLFDALRALHAETPQVPDYCTA